MKVEFHLCIIMRIHLIIRNTFLYQPIGISHPKRRTATVSNVPENYDVHS